jgi:hypothetical protein
LERDGSCGDSSGGVWAIAGTARIVRSRPSVQRSRLGRAVSHCNMEDAVGEVLASIQDVLESVQAEFLSAAAASAREGLPWAGVAPEVQDALFRKMRAEVRVLGALSHHPIPSPTPLPRPPACRRCPSWTLRWRPSQSWRPPSR